MLIFFNSLIKLFQFLHAVENFLLGKMPLYNFPNLYNGHFVPQCGIFNGFITLAPYFR